MNSQNNIMSESKKDSSTVTKTWCRTKKLIMMKASVLKALTFILSTFSATFCCGFIVCKEY